MSKKTPVFNIVMGWATMLGGATMLIISLLTIACGAGLLAGAGSKEVGIMWGFRGAQLLFSGIFFIVTGLALVDSKIWSRYGMFFVAVILFALFKEVILGSIFYTICFINLILAILYLFKDDLRDQIAGKKSI